RSDDGQGGRGVRVARQLEGGRGVGVVGAYLCNTEQVVERQRLELALRAIADQRHRTRAGTRQRTRRQDRGGGGAQCRGQGQLADQQRAAGGDLGQRAESHDGGQAAARILRMAVDILEAVQRVVGGRHQLDDPVGRV